MNPYTYIAVVLAGLAIALVLGALVAAVDERSSLALRMLAVAVVLALAGSASGWRAISWDCDRGIDPSGWCVEATP